ncbi:hypothetical protein TrVFT333_007820 [Trichoderma virens FT-333]|nr:hypothetical protein TrVFT333_007820 [Trichoderma virens FT-333]
MALPPPSSNSSAFLAVPLEIRRQIYRYCIPQNLRIDISSGICYRNPSDRLDEINERHHNDLESGGVSSIDSESVEEEESHLLTDTDEEIIYKPFVDSVVYSENGEEDEHKIWTDTDDEEIIYEPSVDGGYRSPFTGLLLCCRQITEEVTDMLYKENTFQVKLHGDGQFILANSFSPNARENIRKLILILRPMGVSYDRDFRMDPNVWDNILGNISIIGIVAEQPSLLEWPKEELENALEEWTAWITPIVEYLGRSLNSEAKIVVDANDEERTVKVPEQAMPGRCSFQKFPMADVIFKRGRYSLQSGYWDDVDDGPTSCRDIIDDCDYDLYYSD